MDAWDDARKSLNCIEHSTAAIGHGVKILKKCRGGLNGYLSPVCVLKWSLCSPYESKRNAGNRSQQQIVQSGA